MAKKKKGPRQIVGLKCSECNAFGYVTEFNKINEQLKKELNSRPVRVEGYSSGEWVLLDYGDFIVHVFEKNAREFYDLERLWRDAKKVEIPADL